MSKTDQQSNKLLTAEDLWKLGTEGGWFELHHGVLVAVSPDGTRHGTIAHRIAVALQQFVAQHGSGMVLPNVGFVVQRNPDSVLVPDVAFIEKSKMASQEIGDHFIEGSPDLAIEIISPTSPESESRHKIEQYLLNGTRESWLVDSETETVEITCSGAPALTLARGQIIASSVIPGFTCPVANFFA